MNCPLIIALQSVANTNINDHNSNKYNEIITIRKVDDNEEENTNHTFNTLYKSITNETPPLNIKAFASANITPIIHNIVSLTYNNYYYNQITPLTNDKNIYT